MRIRTIKPEFFLHEALFELEIETKLPIRLAFIGLWCAADREGRFKWEPRKLGIQILPYDGADFALVLDALESSGLILRYGEAGEFGCVANFSKHQCVNIREAKSLIPPPPESACESTVHARAGSSHTLNGVNLPRSLRETVIARDGWKCLRCGSEADLTVDHIFPRSMGGTHAITNLRTLCRACNSRRPVAGDALIQDLASDGLTLNDMQVLCMHVNARGEGKGKEGNMEGKGTSTPKAPKGAASLSPEQIEVGSWFGRRASIAWSEKEAKAWAMLSPDSVTEGIAVLAPPYRAKVKFTRQDLQTLLNNWLGEIDRWRNWAAPAASDVKPLASGEGLSFLDDPQAVFFAEDRERELAMSNQS